MGRAWVGALKRSPDTELVGIVDLDPEVAASLLRDEGLDDVRRGADLGALLEELRPDAVVNVTVPNAHLPVNVQALRAGVPVLCEKPAAPDVASAFRQAAAAEAHGHLLMISQSRRYFDGFAALIGSRDSLGQIGSLSIQFSKAPHFGGFREEMAHVLLVDMAVHQFDAARLLLDREPIAVYAEEYNPAWSWFRADANASAIFEFEGGVRFTYVGSWCSPGLETSWNGDWRLSGSEGTATWDGEAAVTIGIGDGVEAVDLASAPEQIDGSLAEFVAALRSGATPSTNARSNVTSLAMVEAAVRSSETGQRVTIADLLAQGLESAVAQETDPVTLKVLSAWRDNDG